MKSIKIKDMHNYKEKYTLEFGAEDLGNYWAYEKSENTKLKQKLHIFKKNSNFGRKSHFVILLRSER